MFWVYLKNLNIPKSFRTLETNFEEADGLGISISSLWYPCLFSPNLSNCLDQWMHFCSELCKFAFNSLVCQFRREVLSTRQTVSALSTHFYKFYIPSSHWEKGSFFCILYCHKLYTVFPRIVSAETILFWMFRCNNYSKAESIFFIFLCLKCNSCKFTQKIGFYYPRLLQLENITKMRLKLVPFDYWSIL